MVRALSLVLLVCAVASGQSAGISERLQRALQSSGRADAAIGALKSGNFVQVEKLLDDAVIANANARPEILALQGAVAFLAGDMPDAVGRLTEASRLAPLSDSDSFTLAMAFVKLGDDERARSLISTLAQKNPNRAIYVYWLGRLDYYQRRYQESIQKLSRATELDPGSPRVWDSLGLAYDMQGQNEQALASLQKASALNRAEPRPSAWPPHDLGFLLLRMDKPREAESALRESLRYDPMLAQAHYHLARALEKENRDAEAVEEYLCAVRQDKTSAEPCYSLAMLYRKLGREHDAEPMFAEYKKRKEAQPTPDLTVAGRASY